MIDVFILMLASVIAMIILWIFVEVMAEREKPRKPPQSFHKIILSDGSAVSSGYFAVLPNGDVIGDVAVWDFDKSPPLKGGKMKVIGKLKGASYG